MRGVCLRVGTLAVVVFVVVVTSAAVNQTVDRSQHELLVLYILLFLFVIMPWSSTCTSLNDRSVSCGNRMLQYRIHGSHIYKSDIPGVPCSILQGGVLVAYFVLLTLCTMWQSISLFSIQIAPPPFKNLAVQQ